MKTKNLENTKFLTCVVLFVRNFKKWCVSQTLSLSLTEFNVTAKSFPSQTGPRSSTDLHFFIYQMSTNTARPSTQLVHCTPSVSKQVVSKMCLFISQLLPLIAPTHRQTVSLSWPEWLVWYSWWRDMVLMWFNHRQTVTRVVISPATANVCVNQCQCVTTKPN